MAAMLGLPSVSRRLRTAGPAREKASPSTVVWVASSWISAPATNAFSPAPVRISTPTRGSLPAVSTARSISCTVARSRAFSFSGRWIVSRAMPSFASYSTRLVFVMVGGPSGSDGGPLLAGGEEVVRPRRLHAVIVEPLARLAAVEPRQDHPLHEGRGGEAPLAELVEHDVGDVIGGVDADQVEERQGAHGVAAAQLQALVDIGDRADPLLEGADGVEDVGNEQAVHDEAGAIRGADRGLAQGAGEGAHRLLDPLLR